MVERLSDIEEQTKMQDDQDQDWVSVESTASAGPQKKIIDIEAEFEGDGEAAKSNATELDNKYFDHQDGQQNAQEERKGGVDLNNSMLQPQHESNRHIQDTQSQWATPEEESKEQAKPQMAQQQYINTGDKSAAQQKAANQDDDDREDEYGRELAPQPKEEEKQSEANNQAPPVQPNLGWAQAHAGVIRPPGQNAQPDPAILAKLQQAEIELEAAKNKILEIKQKNQQLTKAGAKKDLEVVKLEEQLDELRENSEREKAELQNQVHTVTVQSNQKGQLLLILKAELNQLRAEQGELNQKCMEFLQDQLTAELIQKAWQRGTEVNFYKQKQLVLCQRNNHLAQQVQQMKGMLKQLMQEAQSSQNEVQQSARQLMDQHKFKMTGILHGEIQNERNKCKHEVTMLQQQIHYKEQDIARLQQQEERSTKKISDLNESVIHKENTITEMKVSVSNAEKKGENLSFSEQKLIEDQAKIRDDLQKIQAERQQMEDQRKIDADQADLEKRQYQEAVKREVMEQTRLIQTQKEQMRLLQEELNEQRTEIEKEKLSGDDELASLRNSLKVEKEKRMEIDRRFKTLSNQQASRT